MNLYRYNGGGTIFGARASFEDFYLLFNNAFVLFFKKIIK